MIEEHANIERSITQGGYGRRQLYELIQNGADELQREPGGGIHVVLTPDALYCANRGTAITQDGAETILASHLSRKRGTEIGRFGLGFKSVLSICDSPDFFSRSGSFGWDRRHAEATIRARTGTTAPTPVLRVARVLDADAARADDPVLDELMPWATTVIRLPLIEGHLDRLAQDLRDFPSDFVIFSPHIGRLDLDDRTGLVPQRRTVTVRGDGTDRVVVEQAGGAERTVVWKVFERIHRPSEQARRDAGEFHDRDEIPLSWAVPVSGGGQGTGAFWAFFPTTYETTLSGILNAPWKTNEDRQNLLKDNLFNEELMTAAAELIVDSLPELSTDEDPACHLLYITARGREARNWADKALSTEVYRLAARRPSLPDQTGRLRTPTEVRLHPARLDPEWLSLWRGVPGRPDDWCHHSVEETVRRSRAEQILAGTGRGPTTLRHWLEAVAVPGSAAGSAAALRIVAQMSNRTHPLLSDGHVARIVLVAEGRVLTLSDQVFRRTPGEPEADGLIYVDRRLDEDPDLDEDLTDLGIYEADAAGRLLSLLQSDLSDVDDESWETFWALTRRLVPSVAAEMIDEQEFTARVRVRVGSGSFAGLRECLMPGRVVRAGSTVAVDADFHREDVALLALLGLSDVPRESDDPGRDGRLDEYRREMVSLFYASLPPEASRPAERGIKVAGVAPAGPLGLLRTLTPSEAARFLQHLPPTGVVTTWHVSATTRVDRRIDVPSPLLWAVHRYGHLPTAWGVLPVDDSVGPALARPTGVLPAADIDADLATALGLPQHTDEMGVARWRRLVAHAEEHLQVEQVGELYALACSYMPAPPRIRCLIGPEPGWAAAGEVALAVDDGQRRRLSDHDIPVLPVPPEALERLRAAWGLSVLDDVLSNEVRAVPVREPVPVEDLFPRLRFLTGRPLHGVRVVACSELEELISGPNGRRARPASMLRSDDVVYSLEPYDDATLLRRLRDRFGLQLTDQQVEQILAHNEQVRRDARLVAARDQPDDAARLLVLLGADVLRTRIPQPVLEAVAASEGPLDDRTVAELALDVFGSAVLREYRNDLDRLSLDVPEQWAGGHRARRLVTDLGFPLTFAGERQPALEATVVVDGPAVFPPLHEYQEIMVRRIRSVVESRPPLRGMLCLPTGAGKTRTAVQALIESMRDEELQRSRPILWIAQSEELCEQAVHSWQSAWRSLGGAARLTISRLWSGNTADPTTDGFHLVVATDAKLAVSIGSPDYEWLRDAQCVIIDEAHTSLSPRYTSVLAWLGITPHRTRCPLIGLTATPFIGTNAPETERLTRRYNRNRLDFDVDGREVLGPRPYQSLQEMGVLARIRHRELSGATIRLSESERADAAVHPWLPTSAENRLAADHERTMMLVKEIAALPQQWPILVFATSVEHAHVLAALLNRRGVESAAVTGSTEDGLRRQTIRRFRDGEIKVLTNYNVLTQGFDAPATRAIVVARPTYSPNVYQQMIGRGLRGPRNRGKEECLVLDVADNVTHFGAELAFRDFEYLWRSPG
ncbi:DEAD/DEAH box helicase [Micromonospora sp. WP24]|uniref:DEAD/DEAH box helicase family protein n=1 Tax=Micromonospora sp. WP24 TaxID=2604469 RepID=UPI0011DC52DE|nr:DEAD/DEAH box helicase family protein [Micromonospora sp. WP24]TYB96301.1 DEAD/DEAH box helicase [Micromonospora sp. WP24]